MNVIDDLRVTGVAKVSNLELTSGLQRRFLQQDDIVGRGLDLRLAQIWDSGALLGATPTSDDDLAYVVGTWATSNPVISAADCRTVTKTRRCRIAVKIPENYVAGETVTLRIVAGMVTAIADGPCTVDAEAYLVGGNSLISGSDLVTTSATSINSTSFANKDFAVTATALEPGDELDVRITIAVVDAATGSAVLPTIAAILPLFDCKG